MPKSPVYSVRVGGLQFSVWENEIKDKGVMRSVTFNKSYKDKSGEWKTSTSFTGNDLALIGVGIRKVMEFLYVKDSVVSDTAKEEF